MSSAPPILLCLWLVLTVTQVTSGLRCFQCATTRPDDDCITDYIGFVNSSKGLGDKYVKECHSPNDRCMIEMTEMDGVINLFHRGCHDGKTFGEQFDNPQFHNVNPINETTCAPVIRLTCYTFCQTDLCNGPHPAPVEPDPCANFTAGMSVYDYYDPLPAMCGAGDHLGVMVHVLMACVWLVVTLHS